MCKRVFAEQTSENGEIPFYKIGTIGSKADAYISRDLFTYLKERYNYPNLGEILITCSGTIGRCFRYMGEEAYYQDSNIVWIKNKGESTVLNDFLYLIFQRQDWSKLNKSTIKRLFVDDLLKMRITYPISRNEQIKISELFKKLSALMTITQEKYSTLKKYKEGLIQNGLKYLEHNSNSVMFNTLFKPVSIPNSQRLRQYTVGIQGLKPIDEVRYDISSHKTFYGNNIILGIGIEEVGVSEDLEGSISPVYDVYKISDPKLTKYFKYFLKPLFWQNRRFISRKSTRREFEIDTNELRKINIKIPNSQKFYCYINALELIDRLIDYYENSLKDVLILKQYLLNNMFI